MGRPTTYSPEVADRILERLAGGESLRAICRDEGMPSESTARSWVKDRPELAARYARARDQGLDCLADEILEIADTPEIGEKAKETPTGTEVTRADMTEHRRLKIEARKWYLSKLAPKRYGDRQTVELEPGDGLAERLARALERVDGGAT